MIPIELVEKVVSGRGWVMVGEDSMDSTSAYFIAGWKAAQSGDKILVWRGTSKEYAITADGEVVTDGERLVNEFPHGRVDIGIDISLHPEQGPEDDYKFVVEYHDGSSEEVETELAESLHGVSRIVNRAMKNNGIGGDGDE